MKTDSNSSQFARRTITFDIESNRVARTLDGALLDVFHVTHNPPMPTPGPRDPVRELYCHSTFSVYSKGWICFVSDMKSFCWIIRHVITVTFDWTSRLIMERRVVTSDTTNYCSFIYYSCLVQFYFHQKPVSIWISHQFVFENCKRECDTFFEFHCKYLNVNTILIVELRQQRNKSWMTSYVFD